MMIDSGEETTGRIKKAARSSIYIYIDCLLLEGRPMDNSKMEMEMEMGKMKRHKKSRVDGKVKRRTMMYVVGNSSTLGRIFLAAKQTSAGTCKKKKKEKRTCDLLTAGGGACACACP